MITGNPFGDAGCQSDDQCTAGTQGRCLEFHGGPAICECTYDECVHDATCPSGKTCACHGSPYAYGGNACIQGDCRVDADCGAQGFCSPSLGPMSCGLLSGYYCHTNVDQCTDDGDCAAQGGAACMFSTTSKRWECVVPTYSGCPV